MNGDGMKLVPVAHIRSDFREKFGIPRQSGLVPGLEATVVFEPEYRNPDALRGLEGYSHIWLIWQFHDIDRTPEAGWSPTVRPPRIGGNTRMGVFATRSPYRPNPLGLSCVRLLSVEKLPGLGQVLRVGGADLLDGTPVYDIKPYLPHTDCVPDARGGFSGQFVSYALGVVFPPELLAVIPERQREPLLGILAQDPRPSYQDDPERVYGMSYAGYEIGFRVADGVLTVVSATPS